MTEKVKVTNQLETAREWLSDLNKIIDKTDNECTREKRDVLEWLVERIKELEYHNEAERALNKDLHKLQEFIQDNPDLSEHRYGESISLIALDSMRKLKEHVEILKKENRQLNREIGVYAGHVGELSIEIGSRLKDLEILATRMCKVNE